MINYTLPSLVELQKIVRSAWYAILVEAPWGQGEKLVIVAFNNGNIAEYLISPSRKGGELAASSFNIYAYKTKKEAKAAVMRLVNLEFKKPLKVLEVFTRSI